MPIHLLCLLLLYQTDLLSADRSVHILAENLNQVVTSTNLQWIPTSRHDKNLKELLQYGVVAANQTIEAYSKDDTKLSGNGNEPMSEFINKPVYVCRARESVWVAGQLRPKNQVCVVSVYKKVREHEQFDILVNTEGSARLNWKLKSKIDLIPQGSVASGVEPKNFIARKDTSSHNKEGSLTHNTGIYVKNENLEHLGMFYVVDQNNIEIHGEDGEILVEMEPVSYELKGIRFSKVKRGKHHRTQLELGHTILKNEEEGLQRVDSVISYTYQYRVEWVKGHGLITGLPITVYAPDGSRLEGVANVPKEENRTEVAPIERYLEAGTAVNVTLMANYTDSEIPYKGRLISLYKDDETREKVLDEVLREKKVMDVVAVYSPAYFLHNGSHVPTTTTTTSTTTTTTTTTTTVSRTTTQEAVPIATPPNVHDSYTHKTVKNNSLSPVKSHENDSLMSDERAGAMTKKVQGNSASGTCIVVATFNMSLLTLLTGVLVRQVT
nr:unnamed protein product [Callosobruchus analis]